MDGKEEYEAKRQKQASINKRVDTELLAFANSTKGEPCEAFWARSGPYGNEDLVLLVDSQNKPCWRCPVDHPYAQYDLYIAGTHSELLKAASIAYRDLRPITFCTFRKTFEPTWRTGVDEFGIVTLKDVSDAKVR